MKEGKEMELLRGMAYLSQKSMSRFNAFTLTPGTYRVIRAFDDFDGGSHPVGETWRYLSMNFFPYDEGLTLFLAGEDGCETTLRLQDYGEAQGPVIDHFDEYVERLGE